MALVVAVTVGWLTACGIYLLLRARTFSVILGLALLSHAANLTLFFSGGIPAEASPPLIHGEGHGEAYADPLPQALVLTAIVISFAMTAFALILALRNRRALKSDHVDGRREQR
ncbi:Na+/H+ antiporter subunit C [Thiohalorhabdus methylotrophus]|uniref:Na+/H+ antiporter subunit C n=1 Tax=Thiohalorhabdus methylotrophus TaxID=3242694 RepID=A0ABV4TX19_9GAMM